MNLNKIKEIIETPYISDEQKESLIIIELSKNKEVVPSILKILETERKRNIKLVDEMNLLLSKAHVGLEEPNLNKGGFMQKEISKFYDKSKLNHCFNT